MRNALTATLNTPICALRGCGVPVVLAGMGGAARSERVVAVSTAGGFGFLGMVRESPELIRSEIARVRAATARNFGVNLVPAATAPDLLEAGLDAGIQQDETRSCAMPRRPVQTLGGEPSRGIGAFYGKAMAVANLRQRIAYLNRLSKPRPGLGRAKAA